jgi:hypothetical protein
VKLRFLIAAACALFPALGIACNGTDRRWCEKEFSALVSYRAEAISGAFGDIFGKLPGQIPIKFVTSKDPEYAMFDGGEGYDAANRTLIVPRRLIYAKTPNPLRITVYYWPYYQDDRYREEFPVVESIDNMIWSSYLQESAKARGLSWPHKDCQSVDVGKRLPCEMIVRGIGEAVKRRRASLFNTNRMDLIWPQNFSAFSKRVWRTDQDYLDVQHYGGILLIKPLVEEFGVPRTLAYLAQTPFEVEEGDLRTSALRYQERARQALVW